MSFSFDEESLFVPPREVEVEDDPKDEEVVESPPDLEDDEEADPEEEEGVEDVLDETEADPEKGVEEGEGLREREKVRAKAPERNSNAKSPAKTTTPSGRDMSMVPWKEDPVESFSSIEGLKLEPLKELVHFPSSAFVTKVPEGDRRAANATPLLTIGRHCNKHNET